MNKFRMAELNKIYRQIYSQNLKGKDNLIGQEKPNRKISKLFQLIKMLSRTDQQIFQSNSRKPNIFNKENILDNKWIDL